VAHAAEALTDGARMFVATASASPNNRLGITEPSGAQTLERVAGDIESAASQRFDHANFIEGIDDLHPVRVWSRGSVMLADFGTEHTHPQHATELAPVLWPRVLQPWIDRRGVSAEPEVTSGDDSDGLGAVLAVGAAAVLVAGIGSLLLRAPRDDERARRLAAAARR